MRRSAAQKFRSAYNRDFLTRTGQDARITCMIRSPLFGIAIITLALLSTTFAGEATAPVNKRPAAVVAISGQIDDVERDAFMRRFARARASGAKTIIVEIDTYGGLVTSALEMSRYIKRQDA